MTWRIAVDIGGTFTDLVAWEQSGGRVTRAKALTVADDPVRGVVAAVAKAGVSPREAAAFVHGSTIAINAVLQETGANTALLTTQGFRDVLEMGRKNRPDMYNLFFKPPKCLVPRVQRLEVDERMGPAGNVIRAMDESQLATLITSLPVEVESVAICFIHAYANGDHERKAAQLVQAARPEVYVCASSELSGEAREYERTSTAVVNAYVGPLVGSYIGRLADYLAQSGCPAPLLITQSNGGIMTAAVAVRQPVRTMESGPAAGVTGAAWLGAALGLPDLIAFDMGGTSAKACVVQHGEPEAANQYHVGGHLEGVPVQVPFLDIVEVGAGGGSIAHVDQGGALRVGPRSASSVPGPAAYGLGGTEPTITDANVVAGRIDPDYFLGGEMRLQAGRAQAAVAELAGKLNLQLEECAISVIRVANAIMAGAIRAVTVERGRDPRDLTLVAYGGAGPLHAAALAADLRIPRVLVPAGPGTHGAFGMLVTDIRHDVARTVNGRLEGVASRLPFMFATLEEAAARYVSSDLAGASAMKLRFVRRIDLRYSGQFHPLTLTVHDSSGDLAARIAELFHAAHLDRYGHNAPGEPIEATAVRVTAVGEVGKPDASSIAELSPTEEVPLRHRRVMFEDGSWHDCRVYRRAELSAHREISGPCVIEDPATNVIMGPDDRADVLIGGHLMITLGATS